MGKYVEPPKSKETSVLEDITGAAKDAGASFVNVVEDAATAIADSVQSTIEGMVNDAVAAATGAYNAAADALESIADGIESAYDSASEAVSEAAKSVEEAYDDIMNDEELTENSNMQGDALSDADDKLNNLTNKEVKELSENPAKATEMSKGLTDSGLETMKGNILNG